MVTVDGAAVFTVNFVEKRAAQKDFTAGSTSGALAAAHREQPFIVLGENTCPDKAPDLTT